MDVRSVHERIHVPGLFYVLVDMPNGRDRPEFFVVPSRIVAEYVTKRHRLWKQTPGKKGQARGDSDIRIFRDAHGEWLNRWDVFKSDQRKAAGGKKR
jgi:hypothetical protein